MGGRLIPTIAAAAACAASLVVAVLAAHGQDAPPPVYAGTDAGRLRLYVDGKSSETIDAPLPVTTNSLPLYVGAEPDGDGGPANHFRGSIDEVRLSKVARYASDFKPSRFHERDAETVLLYHFDTLDDGLLLDDSGNDDHGWPVGAARVESGRK